MKPQSVGLGLALSTLMLLLTLAITHPAIAEDAETEPKAPQQVEEDRIDRIEEQVRAIASEVGRLESIFVVPEELEFESFSGLGPAASKVYKRDSGLSIGGYGEVRLRTFHNEDSTSDTGSDGKNDVFDALRAVLYVGYKFSDKWVFNSELEFEHGGSGGGGSVSSEFVTIDYLHADEINFRAGLLLVPMGFVNEIHEPTFFFGAERPEVERQILPSTWRENGVGIFGRIADRVDYRFYVINGFDGKDFSSSGLRGGRQKGSRAISNDFAFVGRVDVDVVDGLMFGGSVYAGQSGQERRGPTQNMDDPGFSTPDAMTHIYEIHAQYKGYGASVRALWTQAFIDEAGALSRSQNLGSTASIAQRMDGWYVEAGYNVLQFAQTRASLEPYFRFERYNTQKDVANLGFFRDSTKDIDLYVAGLQFKPIPQVVFKVDFRHFDPSGGKSRADEVQALVGYVF